MRWLFFVLLCSTGLSVATNRAVDFTYLWLILDRGGTGLASGALVTISALGGVVGSIFLTPLIDRFGAVRFSVIGDIVSAGTVTAISLGLANDSLPYFMFAALAFLGAMMDTVAMTARAALVPHVADGHKLTLASANGYIHGVEATAHMLASPIAAGLLVISGATYTLAIFAAVFVASAIVMTGAAKLKASPRTETIDPFAVMRGFRLIWSGHETRILLIVAFVFVMLVMPVPSLAIPYLFIKGKDLGAENLALVQLAGGLAALGSGTAYGWLARRISNATIILVGFAVEGVMLCLMGFATLVWHFALLSFVAGLAAGPLAPLFTTVLQERAPPALLTRVLGAFNTVMYAITPFGFIFIGWQIDQIGTQLLFVVGGLLGVMTGIWGGWALSKEPVHRFDDPTSNESVGMEPMRTKPGEK